LPWQYSLLITADPFLLRDTPKENVGQNKTKINNIPWKPQPSADARTTHTGTKIKLKTKIKGNESKRKTNKEENS
jgi:hypothetical protein